MGIKNIMKLLEKYPEVIEKRPLSELEGSKIAVDTPIFLAKYMFSYLPQYFKSLPDESIIDHPGLSETERDTICEKIVERFMSNFSLYSQITGAEFHMVIEGPGRPEIKNRYAGVRRLESYERTRKRYQDACMKNDVTTARRLLANIEIITLEALSDSLLSALELSEFKYTTAPGEAENYACELSSSGLVDHVLTTDTDCLAMGQSMIKGIDIVGEEYTIVQHDKILESLDMTKGEFMDLCIMSGCDYNDNIPRVGVMNALKLLRKHGSIEGVSKVKDVKCLNHVECRRLFDLRHLDH